MSIQSSIGINPAEKARGNGVFPVNPEMQQKLPRLNAQDLVLPNATAAAWSAIKSFNRPPILFRCGGIAVRLDLDDNGAPILRELNNDRMRHVLARAANWYQEDSKRTPKPALPPMHVVKDMLASADLPLPVLTRIVEAPVYASDMQLQISTGYHAASRCYLALKSGFKVPEVQIHPTNEDLTKARMLAAPSNCPVLIGCNCPVEV